MAKYPEKEKISWILQTPTEVTVNHLNPQIANASTITVKQRPKKSLLPTGSKSTDPKSC